MNIRFRFATLGCGLLSAAAVLLSPANLSAEEVRFKSPDPSKQQVRQVQRDSGARTRYLSKPIRQIAYEEPFAVAQAPSAFSEHPTAPNVVPPNVLPSTVSPPQPTPMAEQDLRFPEKRPVVQQPAPPAFTVPSTSSVFDQLQTPLSSGSGEVVPPTSVPGMESAPMPSSVQSPADSPRVSTEPGLTTAPAKPAPATQLPDIYLPPKSDPSGRNASPAVIVCPDNAGIRSIKDINCDIRPKTGELPKECPLVDQTYEPRHFALTCYRWKAAALCTKGAYFQDVQAERYGHSLCPTLQPVISAGRFLGDIAVLPYKMGLETPNECVYTLGYHRVGNCAPYMLDPVPLSLRGAVFETGAILGAVYLIP